MLGDHEVAIEVKATSLANNRHLKGLNHKISNLCTIKSLNYAQRFS